MKLNLVVMTSGKSEGKAIPITLSQFVIGRDPQCQLRPASASISKRHCAILVKGGKVFIRDFDSTNGTFVNDQQVKGEVELHHDDKVKIGPLLFGVKIEGKPTDKPTPAPASKAPAAAATKPTPPPRNPLPEAVDDESVAALLLSLQDEGGPSGITGDEIPSGSTVVIEAPPTDHDKKVETEPAPDAGTEKPKDKFTAAKAAQGATADAAKAILQKYMRRPRG